MKTTLKTTKLNNYKKPEIKAFVSHPYMVEGYSNEWWSRKKKSYTDNSEDMDWEDNDGWND